MRPRASRFLRLAVAQRAEPVALHEVRRARAALRLAPGAAVRRRFRRKWNAWSGAAVTNASTHSPFGVPVQSYLTLLQLLHNTRIHHSPFGVPVPAMTTPCNPKGTERGTMAVQWHPQVK